MLIKTFESEQEQERVCDVVKIGLRTVGGVRLELPLYSVPMICEPLSHQAISLCKTICDHLMPLNHADFDAGGKMPVTYELALTTIGGLSLERWCVERLALLHPPWMGIVWPYRQC